MRRKRQYHHESKSGHERWLVSYADFITLLFGFFVVMYSVSQVSDKKYRALSETLASVFDGEVATQVQVEKLIDQASHEGQASGTVSAPEPLPTEVLANDLAESLVNLVKSGDVSILATKDSVEININANALFASASSDPSDSAKMTFKKVAEQLRPFDYDVEVAGHTDNVPINTQRFPSNWMLSSARASSIVTLLATDGLAPARLKAAGFGEFQPVADNATEIGRSQNRRVVLTVTKPEEAVSASLAKPAAAAAAEPSKPILPEDTAMQPVRLKSGGLLFSSDPELPRDF